MSQTTNAPAQPQLSDKEKKQQELQKRMQFGKQGKLWRVVVYWTDCIDQQKKRHHFDNLFAAEVRQLREDIFLAGIMVCVSPGEYDLAPPSAIDYVKIYRQANFFDLPPGS